MRVFGFDAFVDLLDAGAISTRLADREWHGDEGTVLTKERTRNDPHGVTVCIDVHGGNRWRCLFGHLRRFEMSIRPTVQLSYWGRILDCHCLSWFFL